MELGPGRSARRAPAEPARAVQPPNGPSGSEPPSQGCSFNATHLLPQRAVSTSESGPGPGTGTYTATRDYQPPQHTKPGHTHSSPHLTTHSLRRATGRSGGHSLSALANASTKCSTPGRPREHPRAGIPPLTRRADSDPAPGGSGKVLATIVGRPRLTTASLGS